MEKMAVFWFAASIISLMMEVAGTCETLENKYETMSSNNTENSHFNTLLKSHFT